MNIKEVDFLPNEFTNFQIYPAISKNTNKDISKKDVLKFDYTNNDKHTFIIYRKKSEQIVEIIAFLTKMLKAVQYNIETDVVLLGINENISVPFAQLKSDFFVKKIISFGVSKEQFSIHGNIRQYVPTKVGNYEFLLSDSLDVLMSHNAKKRQLWGGLKQLFL